MIRKACDRGSNTDLTLIAGRLPGNDITGYFVFETGFNAVPVATVCSGNTPCALARYFSSELSGCSEVSSIPAVQA